MTRPLVLAVAAADPFTARDGAGSRGQVAAFYVAAFYVSRPLVVTVVDGRTGVRLGRRVVPAR